MTNQIMYKVGFGSSFGDCASVSKLNIVKVTEKTVVTDNGSRYLKKCCGYELFDSLNIAMNCAVNHTNKYIERLECNLTRAKEHLEKLNSTEKP